MVSISIQNLIVSNVISWIGLQDTFLCVKYLNVLSDSGVSKEEIHASYSYCVAHNYMYMICDKFYSVCCASKWCLCVPFSVVFKNVIKVLYSKWAIFARFVTVLSLLVFLTNPTKACFSVLLYTFKHSIPIKCFLRRHLCFLQWVCHICKNCTWQFVNMFIIFTYWAKACFSVC